MHIRLVGLILVLFAAVGAARGGNGAVAGKLTEELPTIKCLGFIYLVKVVFPNQYLTSL